MTVLIDKTSDDPVRRICARFDNKPDVLLEILHEVQREKKFLNDASLRAIADALNISRADIHGVVSFYHDFRREAPARHIVQICLAEACQAVGCDDVAADAEEKFGAKVGGAKSADGQVALEAVYCLGNCALGPAVMIDGELFGRVTPARLKKMMEARLDNDGQNS